MTSQRCIFALRVWVLQDHKLKWNLLPVARNRFQLGADVCVGLLCSQWQPYSLLGHSSRQYRSSGPDDGQPVPLPGLLDNGLDNRGSVSLSQQPESLRMLSAVPEEADCDMPLHCLLDVPNGHRVIPGNLQLYKRGPELEHSTVLSF